MDILYLGGLCMIKKDIIIIIFFFIPLVNAETTFFDQDDAFIVYPSERDEIGEESSLKKLTGKSTLDDGAAEDACFTNWICTLWSYCLNEIKMRNCTEEKAYCNAYLKKNSFEIQSCLINKSKSKNETNQKEEYPNEKESERNISPKKTIILAIILSLIIGVIALYIYKRKRKK